jgi:hypothetical protein
MNKSAIEKGIEKMLENLVFKDVDTNYNYRLEGPNKNGKYTLFLEYDVDFKKMVESNKYGTPYQQKIFQIHHRLKSMEKFLGLDYKNFSLWLTFNWLNTDILRDQEIAFVDELKRQLIKMGHNQEEIDYIDLWAGVEFMEEDDPHYRLQVGSNQSSSNFDSDNFESAIWKSLINFPDLKNIADFDLDIWFPDNY